MLAKVGFDASAPKANDHLERSLFAAKLFKIARETPPDWSVRIGLLGRWGEGKTTVLEYIGEFAQNEGHIPITFAPWSAKTRDDLWRDFAFELVRSLDKHGISIGEGWAARAIKGWSKVSRVSKYFGFLIKLFKTSRPSMGSL